MSRKIVQSVADYLKKLNIYVLTNEDTIEKRRNQILATRIFIVLFLVSLSGLVGYTSLSLQLTTIHIESPSQSTFEILESIYPGTLICPCSQTSIQVNKFVNVSVSYHQICSSTFVSDEWISSISHVIPASFYSLDIRRMISSQIQLIASQCQSSQVAVTDALKILGSNQLFIPTMLSRDSLNSQIDIIIGEIKKDTLAEQQQSFKLIQTINQQNQLTSALGSNYLYANTVNSTQVYFLVKYLKNLTYPPPIGVAGYTGSHICYCTDSSNCTYPSGIYPNLTGDDSYTYQGIMTPSMISSKQIPGLQVGCMPLGAIIESTLECFYQNDCLIELFNLTNIQLLNNSNYPINTKIKILIEELFIENWLNVNNFELFFKECQPNKCTYSYNSRGNVAFIITTIFSLIGGLFVALKVVANLIVSLYRKIEKKLKKKSSTTENHQDDSNETDGKVSFVKKLFEKIREWMIKFNLFKQRYNDAHGRRNEILATRIYFLLMIAGFIVIVFYAMIVEHTLTYQVKSPSLNDYRTLVNEYPSLTCECEQITAAYSVFLSLSPTFHQFCSSIYTSEALSPNFEDTMGIYSLKRFNLRTALPSYYTSGQIVCSLIKDTTSQAIDTFLQTIYVSNYLTLEDEFQSRMKAFVNNFEALAPTTFNHLLQLILDTTQGNQLLGGSFTNAKLQYNISSTIEENKINILWMNPNDPSCSCGMSSNSCALSYDEYCNYTFTPYIDGYDTTCYNSVPGLIISCYVANGLLVSSPECFFDLECVTTFLWQFASSLNISLDLFDPSFFVLDKNVRSRFSINSTAGDILSFLGIENWNEKINYNLYYDNCNPVNCFYTITKHFHIPTIVTTVIGLIGGLSVILKILIPPIIKLIRRRRGVQIHTTRILLLQSQFHRLIKKLRNLNLFKTIEAENSDELCHDQILTTRLYIILCIITIIFVSIYTGLSEKTTIIHVDSPSMIDVNQLQSKALNEFSCPCSKITIPFGTFTSLNFTFHQICSSDFISEKWLEVLFNFDNKYSISRGVFSSHFQLLHSFCYSSNESLIDATANFYANQFISVKLLSENEFFNQIHALIQDFQTKTLNSFRRNLALIVDITLGNQFMSIYETNWYFIPDPNGKSPIYTKSRTYQSGNCSCGTSQSSYCIDPLIINKNLSIPGMFIGCLPITSLRLSTLQCFYDQICLDQIKKGINLQNFSLNSLNSTQSSQFSMNTTLDYIIDNLMLEQWTNQINYSEYFNECNLQQCTYSIIKQNNALVIFTTLLGLYGGLTITLDFLAPTIVKIIRRIYNKCRTNRRTVPEPL